MIEEVLAKYEDGCYISATPESYQLPGAPWLIESFTGECDQLFASDTDGDVDWFGWEDRPGYLDKNTSASLFRVSGLSEVF